MKRPGPGLYAGSPGLRLAETSRIIRRSNIVLALWLQHKVNFFSFLLAFLFRRLKAHRNHDIWVKYESREPRISLGVNVILVIFCRQIIPTNAYIRMQIWQLFRVHHRDNRDLITEQFTNLIHIFLSRYRLYNYVQLSGATETVVENKKKNHKKMLPESQLSDSCVGCFGAGKTSRRQDLYMLAVVVNQVNNRS